MCIKGKWLHIKDSIFERLYPERAIELQEGLILDEEGIPIEQLDIEGVEMEGMLLFF